MYKNISIFIQVIYFYECSKYSIKEYLIEILEEEIINKAGQADMITIATSNAGRGTDIILSKDALTNGGLHVIITCYMKNIRTEEQAKGRAAYRDKMDHAK